MCSHASMALFVWRCSNRASSRRNRTSTDVGRTSSTPAYRHRIARSTSARLPFLLRTASRQSAPAMANSRAIPGRLFWCALMPSDPLEDVRVSGGICRDFVYFRQLVSQSRGHYDDNINHRLNSIDTGDARQCQHLWNLLEHVHTDRTKKIQHCIHVLQHADDGLVHRKEVPQRTMTG